MAAVATVAAQNCPCAHGREAGGCPPDTGRTQGNGPRLKWPLLLLAWILLGALWTGDGVAQSSGTQEHSGAQENSGTQGNSGVRAASGTAEAAESKGSGAPVPTFHASSRLVVVPTFVRSFARPGEGAGSFVPDLRREDFRLFDNGVPQTISVEEMKHRGTAVVVLMQTGSATPEDLQNYETLTKMLNVTANSSAGHVGLITFDSGLRQIWNFPPRPEGLAYAFHNQKRGDAGAAIRDAVKRGMEMLRDQPSEFRKILLLLSQESDRGSQSTEEEIFRSLGGSNITVYSVSFAPTYRVRIIPGKEKKAAPQAAAAPTQVPGCKASGEGGGTPQARMPRNVLHRLCTETASEMARISGGEHIFLQREEDLKRGLEVLAQDFSDEYLLSFRPSSNSPGMHTLTVKAGDAQPGYTVAARSSYWVEERTEDGGGL